MPCYKAPSCQAALDEATLLYPNRNDASDGVCASQKHSTQNPNSDHEPNIFIDGRYYATAFDLTDDKANGCDADEFAEQLRDRRDSRIKYVICNRRMFSSYGSSRFAAWEWRQYTGSNPHESHTHVSILPTRQAMFDTSSWFKEDELTEEEHKWLATTNHFVKVIYPTEIQPMLAKIDELYKAVKDGHPAYGIPGTELATGQLWLKVVKGVDNP